MQPAANPDASDNGVHGYSPEFLAAVEALLADEGGYSASPDDPGGVTRFGISSREYPNLDIGTLDREQAVKIYWNDWWLRFGFHRLPAAAVAAKTFNLAVNIGPAPAVRCLQRALRACGNRVSEDGLIGAVTIDALTRVKSELLLAALRSEAAGYYRTTAALARGARADGDRRFLEGWLNRAYR